jgi:hypothetical protein
MKPKPEHFLGAALEMMLDRDQASVASFAKAVAAGMVAEWAVYLISEAWRWLNEPMEPRPQAGLIPVPALARITPVFEVPRRLSGYERDLGLPLSSARGFERLALY